MQVFSEVSTTAMTACLNDILHTIASPILSASVTSHLTRATRWMWDQVAKEDFDRSAEHQSTVKCTERMLLVIELRK